MRRFPLLAGLLVLTACPPQTLPNPSPTTQFYFPTGIVHVDSRYNDGFLDGGLVDAGFNEDGILYVASANFDKRFDNGSVIAVDLAKIGMPAFGAPVVDVPKQILDLKVSPASTVQIASFAGEMAALPRAGGVRLFIPSRSEEHRVFAIDAPTPTRSSESPRLDCYTPATRQAPIPTADGGFPFDCSPTGLSLVAFEKTETGIPRAPSPIGVAVSPVTREVWVTALQQADTPRGSTLDTRAYVVRIDGEHPEIKVDSFVNVGSGATNSIVVGKRYAYTTGRIYATGVPASLVRVVNTESLEAVSASLENTFTVFEGRGVALSNDEARLYVLGRSPDTLLVARIADPYALVPDVRVERSVPLPEGPSLVTAIPRAGKSDLIAITCSTAGVVAFYDDEVGDLVGQIAGVGLQPYAIAVDLRPPNGARLFVTNFTDGRVAVIDVPELNRPASAKIVAFLGGSQLCLTRGVNERTTCDGGTK